MPPRHRTPVWLVLGGIGLATAILFAPLAHPAPHRSGTTLRRVAVIDLPGPPGRRFDYLTIDDDDRYLFSAHLAAGLLYVIDLRTNAVVKAIADVPGVEGVAYVPELKKVYTADWWENKRGARRRPAGGQDDRLRRRGRSADVSLAIPLAGWLAAGTVAAMRWVAAGGAAIGRVLRARCSPQP